VEAAASSGTLVSYSKTIRPQNPEESDLSLRRREILKSRSKEYTALRNLLLTIPDYSREPCRRRSRYRGTSLVAQLAASDI